MALGAVIVAVFVASIVLTALIVTLLVDLVGHARGDRGLSSCRRAGGDLLAATRRLRRRTRS
jgi:hypothetical protein